MEKIYEGMLGETPFFVTTLNLQHMQEIEKLQLEVYESLTDQSILQPLSTEEFNYILSDNGMMIGAYVGGELIALAMTVRLARMNFIKFYTKKYRMSHRHIVATDYKKH